MKNGIRIQAVNTPKDLKTFIRFPWIVYKNQPNWVPPLIVTQKELFHFEKNPFWKAHEYALFLAREGDQVKGRIAVFFPKPSSDKAVGHFGFLETINAYEVFTQLIDHALSWFRERGIHEVMGPFNPSLHHESGVLLDSYEERPFLMMPYNPPYYPEFYQQAGFEKAMDFCAYAIPNPEKVLDTRLEKVTDYLMQKHQLTIRPANKKESSREFEVLRHLYNRSFEGHWGFEPIDKEAFDHLGADLMQIADPDLILIAEKDGEAVGFVLCVPNFNEAFRKIRNGKLWPFGLLKLLWYSRKIKTARIMVIGALPELRHLGIGPVLMRKLTEQGIKKSYQGGEISWVAEENLMMNKMAESFHGKRHKNIRIYRMKID